MRRGLIRVFPITKVFLLNILSTLLVQHNNGLLFSFLLDFAKVCLILHVMMQTVNCELSKDNFGRTRGVKFETVAVYRCSEVEVS